MNSEQWAQAIVRTIAKQAQQKWGDSWRVNLVSSYCDLERAETGNDKATPVNRRTQIHRILDGSEPTLTTICRLLKAVEVEIEFVKKIRI